jgi:hypothetical protein
MHRWFHAQLEQIFLSVSIIGWYKIEGPAGTKLPTEKWEPGHCGTSYPGWLNGDHPMTLDEIVDREVCFAVNGDPCRFTSQIQIRNCDDFYLYYLVTPIGCDLRYCSE